MKEPKYMLNVNTSRLHLIGGCYHSKTISSEHKTYATEDEAIVENQNHMTRCKLCFKGK